jgi:hypothetical protein
MTRIKRQIKQQKENSQNQAREEAGINVKMVVVGNLCGACGDLSPTRKNGDADDKGDVCK